MMQRKGCAIVSGVLMVGFGLGMVFMGTGSPFRGMGGPGGGGGKPANTVGMVGKQPFTGEDIQNSLDIEQKKMQMQMQGQVPSDPMQLLYLNVQVINQLVTDAAAISLADDMGIHLDDKAVIASWHKVADDEKTKDIAQLKAMGKIKDGASQADQDKALDEAMGGSFATMVDKKITEITTELGDPSTALLARAPAVEHEITNALKAKTVVSEDQLKAGFDNFDFDVINFSGTGVKPEDAQTNAAKAVADLKAGKTFEEAQKTYNIKDPAAKTDNTTQAMLRNQIESDEMTKPLSALKAGQVSDPINRMGQVVIYRVKAIAPKLPPDYDKNKPNLMSQEQQSVVDKMETEQIKAKIEKDLTWTSPGLKVFYEFIKFNQDPKANATPASRLPGLSKILDESKTVVDQYMFAKQCIAYMQVGITSDLYGNSTGADKAKYAKAKLDALQAALQYTDSPRSRMDTAKLAQEVGDKAAAFTNLVQASKNNIDYTAQGVSLNAEATAFLATASKDGTLTADQTAQVQKALDDWTKAKQDNDKQQADLAKQQADQQAQMQAENDRIKAEQSKQTPAPAAGTKPTTPPPATDQKPSTTLQVPPPTSSTGGK